MTLRSLPSIALTLLACTACEMTELYEPYPVETGPREVLVNDEPLTGQQIAELETTYGVRVVSGNYWYDAASGLFGTRGMPSEGQLYPGHDFAPLPADASNGTSEVFLNGREMTQSEVLYLTNFTGPIAPGRYWMDGMTNVGIEGDPVATANLYALARQATASNDVATYGGSNDNTWSSSVGSGNYNADNSSGYVHIPSGTGGSGVFVSY